MTKCEVCGLKVLDFETRCLVCSELDQSFGFLLSRNPEAAERWAAAKQVEASVKVGLKGETLANG